MSHDLRNVLENETLHRRRSRDALASQLLMLTSAALALGGSFAGCARTPPAQPTAGELVFGKMCAAIEGVSRGAVQVESQAASASGSAHGKRTFRLVFDDDRGLLRCDQERPSPGSKDVRSQTKYARTPTESLFQFIEGRYVGGIEIGAPDRDLTSTEQQPLEPHLLWFAGFGGYGARQSYADIIRAWRPLAKDARVSQDAAGRTVLSWSTRPWENGPEDIRTLTIDPALGFVPVRNEIALKLEGSAPKVNGWTDIRYEKRNGHFVPVSLDIHEDDRSIKVTCHWESVNQNIDPKVFTVEGFEPRDGTAIIDWHGQRPVFRGLTSRKDEFQKSIATAMSANKPLDVRLEDSFADSRLFDSYVLVFARSPKSEVTRRLFSILHWRELQEGDDEALDALCNFTRLPIDASSPERAAELKTLLARWKLAPPSPDDALLAVVDRSGHLISATTSKQLWPDKMDAKPLTAFLNEHRGPMPDAQQRLADALAQAKRENKRVLVEVSGAGCGWCHVMARYFDRHRSLIEKDYVWIMLDRRFAHGEEVIRKLRPKDEGGVPWMVILDADGKPLITSDGPGGNLGYPGGIKDRPLFAKMWRTTAQRLTDAEINVLLADVLRK
jgi:hypothetical protein